MELLETQDPEKRRLIETTDRHKRELQKEVKALTDRTENAMKNALIIGSVLAASFLVVSMVSTSKKKKKRRKKIKAAYRGDADMDELTEEEAYAPPSLLAQIGDQLISRASIILLDLAKQKLAEYLSNRQPADENS